MIKSHNDSKEISIIKVGIVDMGGRGLSVGKGTQRSF